VTRPMPAHESTAETATPQPAREAKRIDNALALGRRLLAAYESFAAEFALADLGDIELPPVIGSSEADQASLRAAATLYLAYELESARLLPAVEMLAGLFASGALQSNLENAAPLLAAFWRGRKERFSAQERRAFFARLFGDTSGPGLAGEGGRNTEFEGLMINLTEALYRLDEHANFGSGATPYEETRLRAAANRLAANLALRSGGMAGFAARDILTSTQEALIILKEKVAEQAVSARSVWEAVRNITRRYLNESVDISNHVTRGKSGQIVLAWLAEVLPRLDLPGPPLISLDHPVIGAATAWLQASLSLQEPNAATASDGS
jgi:hypothetical protein